MSCSKDSKVNESDLLNDIILEIKERDSYDEELYPLGLFSKEYFKKEAEYAKEQLLQLNKIDVKDLEMLDYKRKTMEKTLLEKE